MIIDGKLKIKQAEWIPTYEYDPALHVLLLFPHA